MAMAVGNKTATSCGFPRTYKPNSAIMKPIGDSCNLRCDYCYYRANHKIKSDLGSDRMSLQLVDKAMRQLLEVGGTVQYIWHGGEPLLAGKDFYRDVVKLQKNYPQGRFRNSIQTNATLIDTEWADFFAENNFGVGISIDGPPEVHNVHRRDNKGRGGFDKTMTGLQKLRDAGNKVSSISVITKASLPHADKILQFFLDIKMPNFSFNPLFEDDLDFSVTGEEYADFLCTIFDKYAAFEDPDIKIEPLDTMVKPFIGERTRRCGHSGLCTNHVVIKNDGGINPCDRFNDKKYEFGNVLNGGMQAAVKSQTRQNFIQVMNERNISCAQCKWFKFCHGSCTIGYIGKPPGTDGPYCQSNKKVLQYMEDNFVFERTRRSGARQYM